MSRSIHELQVHLPFNLVLRARFSFGQHQEHGLWPLPRLTLWNYKCTSYAPKIKEGRMDEWFVITTQCSPEELNFMCWSDHTEIIQMMNWNNNNHYYYYYTDLERGRPKETWPRTVERERGELGFKGWVEAGSCTKDREAGRERTKGPISLRGKRTRWWWWLYWFNCMHM